MRFWKLRQFNIYLENIILQRYWYVTLLIILLPIKKLYGKLVFLYNHVSYAFREILAIISYILINIWITRKPQIATEFDSGTIV